MWVTELCIFALFARLTVMCVTELQIFAFARWTVTCVTELCIFALYARWTVMCVTELCIFALFAFARWTVTFHAKCLERLSWRWTECRRCQSTRALYDNPISSSSPALVHPPWNEGKGIHVLVVVLIAILHSLIYITFFYCILCLSIPFYIFL